MSTVRNSVTCGALNADAYVFRGRLAYALGRIPLFAARPEDRCRRGAGWRTAAIERTCTSSRVIEPCGPVPTSPPRSMPRSLAIFRTGGFASTPVEAAIGAGAGAATGLPLAPVRARRLEPAWSRPRVAGA